MNNCLLGNSMTAAASAFLILLAPQPVHAQVLLAQTGGAKSAFGWVIVLLCIGLGLLVVLRSSSRKSPLKKKR
jgi:hypothetical protein